MKRVTRCNFLKLYKSSRFSEMSKLCYISQEIKGSVSQLIHIIGCHSNHFDLNPPKIYIYTLFKTSWKKTILGQNVQNSYPFSDHRLKTIMFGAKHLYSFV